MNFSADFLAIYRNRCFEGHVAVYAILRRVHCLPPNNEVRKSADSPRVPSEQWHLCRRIQCLLAFRIRLLMKTSVLISQWKMMAAARISRMFPAERPRIAECGSSWRCDPLASLERSKQIHQLRSSGRDARSTNGGDGSGGRIRTCGQLINSQLLYH